MNSFEQSRVWQKTLAPKLNEDTHNRERELLRVEYEKIREKAKLVAGEINRDLPDFTVHDITHIDSLWSLSDLILNDAFNLNPAEAFVLGGAFLIHDLGMGLAAYPDGIENLKKSDLWNDTIAHYYKKDLGRNPEFNEFDNPEPKIKKKALENVLRILHAKHAEDLALIRWKAKGNQDDFYYLIENKDLKDAYGKIIGQVAHSHWWSVEELSSKLNTKLGAPGFLPQDWIIDPIKIACILRIADAANVDDRRSPGFLRALRNVGVYSDMHWNFQQRLYQPRVEAERFVYTSKSPFEVNESDSWWLCFDTLKLLDKELKEVDSLLSETNRQRLSVIAVAGVEDANRLATLIKVKDWQPVDTQIKVGDVANLVLKLGGAELYGRDYTVPLRELIQNGCDAVRARRFIEKEELDYGQVIIRKGEDDEGVYLEVEDNGVGMSAKVLTGPFLDFGQSFWGTTLMHEELPGLEATSFKSTGKFGIGFYSVFMISKKVKVFTRRYEESRESTLCLDFINGVKGRPLLRKANAGELLKNGGTRIRLYTDETYIEKIRRSGYYREKSLSDVISYLCIAVDVDILFQEDNEKQQVLIQANDWLNIPPLQLIKRNIGASNYDKLSEESKEWLNHFAKNISIIKDENNVIYGRSCVYSNPRFANGDYRYLNTESVISVGGLSTSDQGYSLGVFLGKTFRASRDSAIPIISYDLFFKWLSEQAELLSKQSSFFDYYEQRKLATILWQYGGSVSTLHIGKHGKKPINSDEAVSIMSSSKSEIIVINSYAIAELEDSLGFEIELLTNVFEVDSSGYAIGGDIDDEVDDVFPKFNAYDVLRRQNLEGYFCTLISIAWELSEEAVLIYNEQDENRKFVTIGYLNGNPVAKVATVFNYNDLIKLNIPK